jgi:prepilin-type N-terminal cleavage/methylation domain-containing protein
MRFSCINILKNKSRGFTLVEVVIVVGIMSVLSAIIYASFDGAKAKSRDQQRMADISSIQLALEIYFNKNKQYPESLTDLQDGTFTIPTPPRSSENYIDNYFPMKKITATTERCISYHLWTKFENTNSFLESKKGFDSTGDLGELSTPLAECGSYHNTIDASDLSNSLVYDVTP